MTFIIRYRCGEAEVGDAETAQTIEEARRLVDARKADLDHEAEILIIFRLSPSGTEELEESRKLRA
jgi:hypothetical protein